MASIPEQPIPRAGPPSPDGRSAEGAIAGGQVCLGESQRDALNVIRRTLAERSVFAALTGAPGLGKSMVLSLAIAAQTDAAKPDGGQMGPPRRIIKVDRADQVSAEQAAGIERLVLQQSGAPGSQQTVIFIDDAHAAPPGLLRCLTRIAEHCWRNPGVSQVILVGQPELWARLKGREFAPLAERIAVRPVLQPMTDEDMRCVIKHHLEQPRRIIGQALTEEAEREMLRLAEGKPERIQAIVRSTLAFGDLRARTLISMEMINDVAAALDGRRPRQGDKHRSKILKPALVAATVAAITIGVSASDWPLRRLLPAARNLANDAFPSLRPSAVVAEGLRAEVAPAIPVPPPVVPDAVSRAVAEAPPPAAPGPAAPTLPQMPDQPASVAAKAPAQPGQTSGADRAQAAVEPPVPAIAAVPQQAPPEASYAGPAVVASLRRPPGNTLTPLAPELVKTLLRRGDEGLALGDISTARRFYERAIAAGSAQGARGIARTYDPAVLGQGNPAASPVAAEAWYNAAAVLDDVEASARRAAFKGVR